MGLPPLLEGAVHSTVMEELEVAVTVSSVGGEGGTAHTEGDKYVHSSVNCEKLMHNPNLAIKVG